MGLPSSFTPPYGTILVHCELLSCLCSIPFFFVSIEITGWPTAWVTITAAFMCSNHALRSGLWLPSKVLRFTCRWHFSKPSNAAASFA